MTATPLAGHSRDSIIRGFATLRTVTDPRGHDLLAVLEEEALWLHESLCKAHGLDDIDWSRKVPDTPALRLVGEADARSRSLPDHQGLPISDPRVHTLRDEGA